MANFIDKTQVPVAIADNTKLDLSCKHITTANWMQLNPVYWKELVPGEKLEVGVESFTRLNPLVVPTFAPGSKLKISRFFVPFRTIFRGWNDFITDSFHVASTLQDKDNGLIPRVPYFTNATLLQAMEFVFGSHPTPLGSSFAVSASSATTAFDYKRENNKKYVYTNIGRQALKVLQSLGYKINPNVNDEQEFSALPLLAYAKVYADYYWPSAYMDSYAHYFLEEMFNYDASSGTGGFELTPQQVALLLRYTIYVCYDSDYFVSAFDNPVAPSDGNYSELKMNDYSIPNPFYANATVTSTATTNRAGLVINKNRNYANTSTTLSDTFGTPIFTTQRYQPVGNTNVPFPVLTQYADSMLHRLTDYMKRHQLAGSRAMERYLSRFGKSLSAEKLNRSVYLGTDYTTIQIGDVMSTSDTVDANGDTGASLGAYAGKGIAYGNYDGDSFSTDEYGIYLITASLVPDVFYDQGVDYNNYHIYKTEFWTPEFDYGMRAITADELFIPTDGTSDLASGSIHNQIFGFTPRYSEYRVGRSRCTGSFRIPSLNGSSEFGSDAWHMMREFNDRSFGAGQIADIVHSPSFVYGVNDAGQYNRIFFNSDSNAPDQFVMIYSFTVKSYSPMPSLYDNYDWCDEQSGHDVSVPVNGVQVN